MSVQLRKNAPFENREAYLNASLARLKPIFEAAEIPLPENNIRAAISPLPQGRNSTADCALIYPDKSDDGSFEFFISARIDDPVKVNIANLKLMLRTSVSKEAGLGKEFQHHAAAIGFRPGPKGWRNCEPKAALMGKIKAIVEDLGPLPHASVDLSTDQKGRKKGEKKLFKAECKECGYPAWVTKKWLRDNGPPFCGRHGEMQFDATILTKPDPEDEAPDTGNPDDSTPDTPANDATPPAEAAE